MRKRILLLVLALLLTGCGREDPYRVDTVVWIPVDPTQAPTVPPVTETQEPATEEALEATTPETEAPETDQPTEPPKKTPTSGQKPPSNKNNSSGQDDKPKETAPAATQPPATEPVATEPKLYDISGYAMGSLCYGISDEINALRSEAGVGELTLSSRLSAIASCRGYELSQLWSHTRPDGRGFATVLADYGYGAGAVTELLVYDSGGADGAAMVAKWAGSEAHLQSLLSENYTTAGVGIYRADGYLYVCVLLVG